MATTTPATAPTPGTDRLRRLSLTQRILARPAAGALIIVVFVWVVFAAISLAKGNLAFIAPSGTLNYLDVAAQVGIVGTAVALLMIAGEFDLSIGSLVGFAGIVIGIGVTIWGLPVWLSILMAMAATTVLGVLNGIIVVRTGLPSFIVTLATLFIIRGFSSVLTSVVTNITYIPIDRTAIANDPIAGLFNWSTKVADGAFLKVSILWWLLIAVIGIYILGRTRFGNWIAGVGGSATAARNLGVPVARVKISLFALTAFSASVLATIQSMTFFSADILRGTGIELDAITTAVIGGSLLTGGYGSVAGTALGALSLGMARQGIVFADINADWYKIAIGTLLLVAVVLNNWIRRRFAGL
ncbi:MAG: simple sugar transport system permease protein [Chloroflexota bacterium]|nr:simple sugar transport system permease protein [Chloroflexota bacterium]MEA2612626.1 simple sugar transport system permease protein [Chloroflexota bacterium]